jgi:hypothetical protein
MQKLRDGFADLAGTEEDERRHGQFANVNMVVEDQG